MHDRSELSRAYASAEAFEAALPKLFRERLGPLLPQAREAVEKSSASAQNSIANKVNALTTPPDRLEEAPALILGRDRKPEADALRDAAADLILDGGFVPQFLFSGAATRLGMGPLYLLDVRRTALLFLGEDVDLPKKERAVLLGAFDALGVHGRESLKSGLAAAAQERRPRHDLGLGPRQLLEYRLLLRELSRKAGRSPQEARRKVPIVIHLPGRAEEEVVRDLHEKDFYGFGRENAYLLTQPLVRGCTLRGGEIARDRESPPLPAGHGYPMMQLKQKGAAFRLDEKGSRVPLDAALIDALLDRGARVMAARRINDLSLLTPDALDIKRISMTLALMGPLEDPGKGSSMVVELVSNPENQKGGFWKLDRTTGRKALAETLNLKTPELEAFMGRLKNPPYNAFRNCYKLSGLRGFLDEDGFSPFLRFRHDRLYPETITGEATESEFLRTEAFRKTGELINDFKEPKDLPQALRFIAEQDTNQALATLISTQ